MPALKTSLADDVLVVQFKYSDLRDLPRVFQTGAELLDACAASPGKMLLEFSGVEYMTSEMLGQLFVLANRCKGEEVMLLACSASPELLLILETVRFVDLVPIYADRATAQVAFDAAEDEETDEFSVHPKVLARAAAEGDLDAEFDLGVCFEQGSGVEQNLDEALGHFRRAAEGGHAEAQHKMGAAYAYGIHVPQNYDEALAWYRRAAEQDQVDALYALGMSYRYGIGVAADQQVAAGWYEQAAEQGHECAREELTRMSAESQT